MWELLGNSLMPIQITEQSSKNNDIRQRDEKNKVLTVEEHSVTGN